MLDYYRNRAIRILPSYYVAIIVTIIFHQCVLRDVTADIFKLGWFRYFIGFNMMIPSDNYYLWNNAHAFWTMSCFMWFYILTPLILGFVRTLRQSVLFLSFTFLGSYVWKVIMFSLFSVENVDSLYTLANGSPFGVLYQFAFGIMTYFALKEEKENEGIAVFVLSSVLGLILGKNVLIWCSLCGIMIIVLKNKEVQMPDKYLRFVRITGKESYHIYLAHMLSFDIAKYVVNVYYNEPVPVRYVIWLLISVVLMALLCFVMNICERVVRAVVM